jgi:CRP-like cAMP-binding protein
MASTAALRPFLAKLERRAPVSAAGRQAFENLAIMPRSYDANHDILSEGDRPKFSCLVQTGLTSRYKTLRDGSRQIVSFHIPGDMVDLQSALVVVADCGIRSHTRTEIIMVRHDDLLRIAAEFPEFARAFWFDTLVDSAVFREWTVNVGRRNARQGTAHLLLEMAWRFEQAGMMENESFDLPISQSDLSDALGISPVHLNRTLQWLRAERLISTHSRTVVLTDRPALVRLSGFDPSYLHPEGPRN